MPNSSGDESIYLDRKWAEHGSVIDSFTDLRYKLQTEFTELVISTHVSQLGKSPPTQFTYSRHRVSYISSLPLVSQRTCITRGLSSTAMLELEVG